jgi:hypothetical protein
VVKGSGIRLGGREAASPDVLNDVASMKMSGLMKISARRISSA